MFKRKILSTALPLLLVGGGCVQVYSGKATEKKEIPKSHQTVTTVMYTDYLVNFMVDLEEANKSANKLLKLDESLNSVDMEFKSEIHSLKTSIKVFKSIEPPKEYKEAHSKLINSIISLDKGLDLVEQGIIDVEGADFKTGKQTVIDSAEDYIKGLEEIDKLSGGEVSEAIDTWEEDK
ncbi:DUF6376 family protein [Bacillus toyonensis]|uniref:DUF6376 family protein n=1 Tax=Bacillus toyonensis TaxID=155322 RepID=UPI000BF4F60C|nr:DUF6376 family protein [Bacillus toyonensis]PGF05286.1 hypothetical protein COM61_02425 [Bacillus toyonensis]